MPYYNKADLEAQIAVCADRVRKAKMAEAEAKALKDDAQDELEQLFRIIDTRAKRVGEDPENTIDLGNGFQAVRPTADTYDFSTVQRAILVKIRAEYEPSDADFKRHIPKADLGKYVTGSKYGTIRMVTKKTGKEADRA